MSRKEILPKNQPDKIMQVSVGLKKKHIEWIKSNQHFDLNTFVREHLEWYITNTSLVHADS